MFSGMLAGFLKVAAVAVVTGGFVGGIYWAFQISESEDGSPVLQGEPSVTVTITPEGTTAPTATQEPAPTATPQPPAPTATPQPPAPTATYTPKPTCLPKTHNHLDIGLLGLQPGMEDAIITEVDQGTIRVELEGFKFLIFGQGNLLGIAEPRDVNEVIRRQVGEAVQTIAYEC